MNRPDLIEQLSKLTPTIELWKRVEDEDDDRSFHIVKIDELVEDTDWLSEDDGLLITLAPAMRLAILDMAKEIEELKNEIMKLKRFNSTKKILGGKPKIQMVTGCGMFEPIFTNASTCKNCGKHKLLHVTPQPK